MEGWIKLHRKLTDWEWYNDLPTFKLFMHILLTANYQPTRYQGNEYEAGELITTLGSLADGCGLSKQQVRTALDKLESTGEITRRATHRNIIVKVLKYADYQASEQTEQHANNTQITRKQHADNTQITRSHTILKENKNTRIQENKKYIFTAPSVADVREYCRERNNNVDAEQFVDFYSSKGWMVGKNKMKDWKAAVRNWEKRDRQERQGRWNGTDSQYDGLF